MALLVCSLALVLTASFVLQQTRFTEEELQERGTLLTNLIAQDLRLEVFAGNREQMETEADKFLRQQSVVSLAIVDADNRLLLHQMEKNSGSTAQLQDKRRLQQLLTTEKSGISIIRQDDGTVEFFAPISMEEESTPEVLLTAETTATPSRPMGYVRLVLRQNNPGSIAKALKTAIIVVTVFLCLGLAMAYVMARRVTRPLSHLYQGIAALEDERFDTTVPVETLDEIGALATGFNQMQERLRQRTAERESALLEVRAMNNSLEERVRQRTEELQATLVELEMFNYSASHDLRAPLARLDGFCEILRSDCADRLGEQGSLYLDKIAAAGRHMKGVVEAMNSLYNVQRQELKLTVFDLAELVDGIGRRLQEAEPERRVTLRVPEHLPVRADARLLHIAMENLVGNAWKFTSGRSRAEIELGTSTVEGTPCYYLRDNGAGFDMAFSDKLFKPFYRLHHADEFPGTGVGLTIVQRVFERHGGRLWLEGAVDEGATCYFTLPA
jgi:hypothetical protein